MKKILCLAIVLIFALCGCSNKNMETTNNTDIRIWTDEKTGVQYVVYSHLGGNAGMGGITPRLNKDGSLYVGDAL